MVLLIGLKKQQLCCFDARGEQRARHLLRGVREHVEADLDELGEVGPLHAAAVLRRGAVQQHQLSQDAQIQLGPAHVRKLSNGKGEASVCVCGDSMFIVSTWRGCDEKKWTLNLLQLTTETSQYELLDRVDHFQNQLLHS